MSVDYGERERQFLDSLKADTGRGLDEWMAAIAAAGLTHRNDIIDWLRRQGFMFSKASWLERIHNNGGRPIYAGAGSPRARARPRRTPPSAPRPVPAFEPASEPAPAAPVVRAPPVAAPPSPPESDAVALEALLARAKAFRPLAVYVVAEVRKAVPDAAVVPRDGYVLFRRLERDFALLAVTAKELRLALALAAPPAGVPLVPARLALRGAPAMSHMTVLTDARQVTPALLAAVAHAAAGG